VCLKRNFRGRKELVSLLTGHLGRCKMRLNPEDDMSLKFDIELEQENDGRWIAEIPALPGVMVYGKSRVEAVRSVQALALHVLADRLGRDTNEPPERDLVVCLNSPL
jgi:predicted RNase H-like HicB family nuclease